MKSVAKIVELVLVLCGYVQGPLWLPRSLLCVLILQSRLTFIILKHSTYTMNSLFTISLGKLLLIIILLYFLINLTGTINLGTS